MFRKSIGCRGALRLVCLKVGFALALLLSASWLEGETATFELETANHGMATGGFGVAWISGNDVWSYAPSGGLAKIPDLAGSGATRIVAANLTGDGDGLAYVVGGSLCYYDFSNPTTPAGTGAFITDIAGGYLADGETTESIVAATGSGGWFYQAGAGSFLSGAWASTNGAFFTVTRGNFSSSTHDQFMVINGATQAYGYDASTGFGLTGSTWKATVAGNLNPSSTNGQCLLTNTGGELYIANIDPTTFVDTSYVDCLSTSPSGQLAIGNFDGGGQKAYWINAANQIVQYDYVGATSKTTFASNNSGWSNLIFGPDPNNASVQALYALPSSDTTQLYRASASIPVFVRMISTKAYWSGGGDGNWSTAANWGGTAPSDGQSLTFTGTSNRSTINDSLSNAGLIVFDGSGFSVSGGSLVLTGVATGGSVGIVNRGNNIVGVNVQLAQPQDFTSEYGNLIISGNVDTNGNALTVAGDYNTQIAGAISGGGGVSKSGAGTAILSGSNIYLGGTTVNGGILMAATTASLPGYATPGKVNVASGATLAVSVDPGQWGASDIDTLRANASIISGGYLGLGLSATNSFTYSSNISSIGSGGKGGLNLIGAGTVILTGNNTYSGGTSVTDGVLVLSSLAGTAIPGNITFGNASNTTQPYIRTTQNNQFGTGTVVSFINNLGGWTRVELQGTEQTLAGISDSIGAGVVQCTESNVGGASLLTLAPAATSAYSFNGWLRNGQDNPLSLIFSGPGTQTLVGGNINYTGTTTISGGTLGLKDTTTFSSQITLNAAGVLNLESTAGYLARPAITNLITGFGTINVNNPGSGVSGGWLAFNSVNSGLNGFSGLINVNSGVLSMDNLTGRWTGSPNLNVNSGGVLAIRGQNIAVATLTGNGDVGNTWSGDSSGHTLTVSSGTFSGNIHGSAAGGTDGDIDQGIVALAMVGPDTLVLSGTNTYSGGTTVTGGTLIAASDTALPDGTSLTVGADAIGIFGASAAGAEFASNSLAASPVPEPGTLALLTVVVCGAAVCRRTRQRRRR